MAVATYSRYEIAKSSICICYRGPHTAGMKFLKVFVYVVGGHYTAYGLNHVNEQWYEFDDQYVTEVDIQQVENCEAYVLFYRSVILGMVACLVHMHAIIKS